MSETLLQVGIDELMPDPNQPRKTFLPEEIERLAASIKARGLLMPLRVLWDENRRSWRIVTGESRWRAARLAGLTTVPCLPVAGLPDEADLLADQIIENSVRNDLLPLEFARSLAKLKALKGLTSRALAQELGISSASVTRAEALLSLPEPIQAMVDDGRIPASSAYTLSRLPDEAAQLELASAIAQGMSRDQVTDAVGGRIGKRKMTPKASRIRCIMGDVSVTFSAGQPLTWEAFNAALARIGKAGKKLSEDGKDITALAKAFTTP